MSTDDRRWFTSKLDWWIAAILIIVPIIEVTVLISSLRNGDREGLYAGLVGCGIVAAIYGLLIVPVRYGIGDEDLLVRFGVVRQHIRFDSIVAMYPTRSPLSSAALSLDRLAITTGRGPVHLTLISPVDREEFISLLTSRAKLRWDGSRWVPSRTDSVTDNGGTEWT